MISNVINSSNENTWKAEFMNDNLESFYAWKYTYLIFDFVLKFNNKNMRIYSLFYISFVKGTMKYSVFKIVNCIKFIANFCPHHGSFLLVFSLRFGQILPLAIFRWITATHNWNAESCNCIPSYYCLPYGYRTQNSYPRLRLITWRRPDVKFGRNAVRKTTKDYQDEDKSPQ